MQLVRVMTKSCALLSELCTIKCINFHGTAICRNLEISILQKLVKRTDVQTYRWTVQLLDARGIKNGQLKLLSSSVQFASK